MENTAVQPRNGCEVCGRYAEATGNTRMRELRMVNGRWLCRGCAKHPRMIAGGHIREDKLLNLIENWYG
jgi:formylmethanofuran dehydrogenase subunit E